MKRYGKYLVILILLISILFIGLNSKKININKKKVSEVTGTTKYYDFSSKSEIPSKYSYSNLFYTKNTTFEVLKSPNAATYTLSDGYRLFDSLTMSNEGEEIWILIRNCGYGPNGEVVDVVLKQVDFKKWTSTGSSTKLELYPLQTYNNQLNPSSAAYDYSYPKAGVGLPITFATYIYNGEVEVDVTYYKGGTYNKDTNTGELLGITNSNAMYYDIDSDFGADTSKIFDGKEGFRPVTGKSNIYYNKNQKATLDSKLVTMNEESNGLAVNQYTMGRSVDGLFYQTAAYVTTDDIEDSTYKFKYSGGSAGILYAFVSPYRYKQPNPIKTTSSKKLVSGENLNYFIDVVIPNNYFSSALKFDEVYPTIKTGKFNKLIVEDIIDSSLRVGEVLVEDELGNSLNSKFDIVKTAVGDKTKVSVSVKDVSTFDDFKFYNKKYRVVVTVSLKDNATSPISNKATVEVCNSGDCDTTNSNINKITGYYRVITNYYKENSTVLLGNSKLTEVEAGSNYSTTGLTNIPEGYELVEIPNNAHGENISHDVEVNYYYRLKKYTVTVKYYLENTTDSVMDDKVITKSHGEAYTTDTNGLPSKYEVKNNPANKSGTLVKNEEVIYYVGIKKAKLVVKYLKEDNTPLYPQEEKEVEYDSIYSTTPKNDEHYKVVEIIGKERDTVDKDNIEVIYKYKLKDSEIDTSITKSGDKSISDLSKLINYDINYRAAIKHYNGNVVIKIVDTIPYKIDTDKSILNGGVYDQDNLTITWTYNWNNITFTDNTKDITINAKLKYIDVSNTTKLITNKVEGYLEKDGKTNKVITTISSKVGIPSKVVVKHLIKGTNDKLGEDVIITDKVIGDSVSIKEIEKEGYRVVEKPVEVFTIEDKVVEKIYYYEKIKVKVTTKSNNPGGEIVGDEEIEYGKDSTPNKIKIRTKRGFLIDRVLINGKEINIPKDKDYLEIDNFDNLKEDKLIEVFYKEGEVNPETSNNINSIVLLVSIIIISTISVFMYRKVKKS